MKIKLILPLILASLLCGCAGGPVHDYYNPSVVGAKFKGPVTVELVDDIEAAKSKCLSEGYTIIGTCAYGGRFPKSDELIAQAKRVSATHVIYSSHYVPGEKGSWSFNFGSGFGSGQSGNGHDNNYIIFLGK